MSQVVKADPGLTIGNPPWEKNRPMATIDRMQVQLQLLSLLGGHLMLRRSSGTDDPLETDRLAAARATASSPSGWNARIADTADR
jgi:hypothetical protein